MKRNLKNDGVNFIPAHMPTLSVLHKVNSESNSTIPQVIGHLYNFAQKKLEEGKPFIRSLKLMPDLFVSFYTDEQIQFYNHFATQFYTVVSFDDTGNIIKSLQKGKRKQKSHINLFQLVLRTIKDPSVPIGQLLSSKKDLQACEEFLLEWSRVLTRSPDLFIMDGAAALHLAACRVFNKMSIKEYYFNCWKFLNGLPGKPINTLLRMDRTHFVAMVIRWLKKNRASKEAKEIFGRAICRCVDEADINRIFDVFVNILLCTMSPVESWITRDSKEHLGRYILDSTIKTPLSIQARPTNEEWFNDVLTQVLIMEFPKGLTKNNCKINRLPKYLLYLSRRVFLWSDVFSNKMDCPVKEPNSCNIESFFNILKHKILESEIHEIDEFVKKFFEYLDGCLGFREGK